MYKIAGVLPSPCFPRNKIYLIYANFIHQIMTFDIWGEAGGVGWVGGNWTEEDGLSGFYVFTSTSHKEF